ncbi:MAG: transglycosylase domain-containing protein [Balneolaceae bacterium]
MFFLLVLTGVFGPVPGRSSLENIQQMQASRVVSADGIQMGTFHLQNRTTVSIDEISPEMIDALIAIEDIRFYDHNGIDARALARVFVRTILLGQNAGGGSTITQQLAKNLYPRANSSGLFLFTDKLREMIIAYRIEKIYDKDDILELYLNTVSFGEDTFGIEMASWRFFNKPPSDLDLEESATLAGLLQATTFYNPYRNPERSEMRRNVVLRQMERHGLISSELAEQSIATPLITNYSRSALGEGLAPYFREQLREELQTILKTKPALDGRQYDLNTDGLVIHTTIDSRIQRAAEKAVATRMRQLQSTFDRELEQYPIFGEEDPDVLYAWRNSWHYQQLQEQGHSESEIQDILHTPVSTLLFTWDGYEERVLSPYDEIRYYISFLNAGFLAMSPQNGHIRAWVGGIDHRHFHYDQVKASRQPGSAFKPILYAAALEAGRAPCDYQRNMLATFTDYDGWTPRNHQEEYGGRYSLQAALAQSVNTVAVHVAIETGVPAIQKTASAMGIQSVVPEAPSIALGTGELSLLELTTAYTSFLNEGRPATPQMITRIYNSNGQLIYDFTKTPNTDSEFSHSQLTSYPLEEESLLIDENRENEGISPETAATMVQMLEKGIAEGTGAPLRSQFGIHTALGGKTGTTQQFSDGWFIGFTPDLVFGTRVGGWNNRVRFREFPAYASQTALPIAGLFLMEIGADPVTKNDYMSDSFLPTQVDSPHNFRCEDYQDDRLRDRLRDFFTGRSSDEPREIGTENGEEKSRNIFRRLGRKLGIQ